MSAYAGPIQQIFSPTHVSLSFSNRADINEDVIRDKVGNICVFVFACERSGSVDESVVVSSSAWHAVIRGSIPGPGMLNCT